MRLSKEMLGQGPLPNYLDIEYDRVCWNCGKPVNLGHTHCECGATKEINFSLPRGRLNTMISNTEQKQGI